MKILSEDWLSAAEKKLEDKELRRRELSDLSYDLIKKCGLLVSSLHRSSDRSVELYEEAEELHAKLLQAIRDRPELLESEEETAFQEFAEASSFYSLLKQGTLPDLSKFYNEETALLGLADLIGELKRALVDAVIGGDQEKARTFFEWMNELFDALLRFEYPRSIVRGLKRKLDVDRSLVEDARMVLATSKKLN